MFFPNNPMHVQNSPLPLSKFLQLPINPKKPTETLTEAMIS